MKIANLLFKFTLLCLFYIGIIQNLQAQTVVAGPCGTTVTINNASSVSATNGSVTVSGWNGDHVYAYWNNNFTAPFLLDNGNSGSAPQSVNGLAGGTYPLFISVFNADFSVKTCEGQVNVTVGPEPTCSDFATPTITSKNGTTGTSCNPIDDGSITLTGISGAPIMEVYYGTTKYPVSASGSVTVTNMKAGAGEIYVSYFSAGFAKSYCQKIIKFIIDPLTPCIPGCSTDPTAHNYLPNANQNATCLTCSDGIQNGDETAVDCGGANCEPCCAADKIAGSVYGDNNADGKKGSIEPKITGVTVTAFDENAQVAQTTTTNGGYEFSGLTAGKTYRIEFSNLPTTSTEGFQGIGSGTSVQFVTPNTCNASLGISYAGDYCQSKPDIVTTVMSNGNQTGTGAGIYSVVKFGYDNQDVITAGGAPPTTLGTAANSGALYGVAYHRTTNKIISAAFNKRHVGFGPQGIGGLYVTDLSTSTTSPLVDLSSLASFGTDPHSGLPADFMQPSVDAATFPTVGKIGIGDIDLSDDGKDLYAINLNTKELMKMTVGSTLAPPTAITNYPIANPGCANGDYRPFATKVYHGKVYVGVTCTAETSQLRSDLRAKVLSFDPVNAGAGFSTVLDFPLDYTKGSTDNKAATFAPSSKWYPWLDTWDATKLISRGSSVVAGAKVVMYPSPWLTDIEFDVDGAMIVGLRDRFGDQSGHLNFSPTNDGINYIGNAAGDLLRAGDCTKSGIWTIENDATVCGIQTQGKDTLQGPGGGEFYWSDYFRIGGSTPHNDITMGALALAPGTGEVITTVMDPHYSFTAGVSHFNNKTGARGISDELYKGEAGFMGKANGLGDLEVLCNPAPIQIGNRVFMDANKNGEQDANEMGLDGITIKLFKAGAEVASTSTANGGQWYFPNLVPEMDYEVKILAAHIPTGKELTTSNVAANAKDLIDNDAALVGVDAVIAYKTGTAGQNNHTLDFGFKVACLLTATAASTNPKCNVGTDGTVALTVTGAIGIPTYMWSNGTTTKDLAAVGAGTYTVTVTESPSCTAIATMTLTEPTAIVLVCTKTDATTIGGSEGTATVAASGGTSPYTYAWSNTQTTATISGLPKGTYTVTVTDANACTSTCSSTVSEPACNLTATATGTNPKCNAGTDGVASVEPSGNVGPVTYAWSNTQATQVITGLAAGTYTVTVTELPTCTAVATVTLTQPTAIVLVCSKTDATTTGGSNGTATVAASGGSSPYTYSWTNGSTSNTQASLPKGTYTVTVTDANGCTSTCSSIVNEPSTAACDLIDAGLKVYIDQKGTATTADDEYVISANPIGTGLAATYNVTGDITKTGVAYGSVVEIGRVPIGMVTVNVILTDAGTSTCSVADGAYNLNGNSCLLLANPTVLCNDNGTPTVSTDDTYSITINPTGNSLSANYNVSGDLTASNLAYGSAQQIATGLAISAGGKTISVIDAIKVDCKLLNINIAPPATCSSAACNLGATNVLTQPTCSNNDGAIALTVSGANGTPTYLWSNGATTKDLSGLIAGTYTVTITDNVCPKIFSYDLSIVVKNISFDLCPGDTYKLETSNTALTNIQWQLNGVNIAGATGTSYVANAIGVYTYTSNNVGGCAVGQCCPIELVAGKNCCKPLICAPVKLTRN